MQHSFEFKREGLFYRPMVDGRIKGSHKFKLVHKINDAEYSCVHETGKRCRTTFDPNSGKITLDMDGSTTII